MLANRVKKLYGIDPKSWEHPADRATLTALRQLKGFDEAMKAVFGATTEKMFRLYFLSSSVRVTERQFPKVYGSLRRVEDVFEHEYHPEVYVTRNPFLNAGVFGVKEPFIIVNSSALQSLDDLEFDSLMAHEFGHIMSGHAVYKTLLYLLLNLSLAAVPVLRLIVEPLVMALCEWDRKSELTADRAGLLGVQDEDASYRLLMKMAGGDDLGQMNLNDFFAQAAEYDASRTLLDTFFKFVNSKDLTHPLPVVRLAELKSWAAGGQYAAILDGMYLKRDFHETVFEEEFGEAKRHYEGEYAKTRDDLAEGAKKAKEAFDGTFRDIGDAVKRGIREVMGGQPASPPDPAAPAGDGSAPGAEPGADEAKPPQTDEFSAGFERAKTAAERTAQEIGDAFQRLFGKL